MIGPNVTYYITVLRLLIDWNNFISIFNSSPLVTQPPHFCLSDQLRLSQTHNKWLPWNTCARGRQNKWKQIIFQSPGWARLQVRNQFILQSQLHGLACSTRDSSRGAVDKVSLGRVVRLLLDRSKCLQEGTQSKDKIKMGESTKVEPKS